MPLGDTDYIAVSHVWGSEIELEWRSVPGIEGEILATERKVEFLTEQLPSVVGESYFWMDILCVDQRNEDARIAVTRHIPAIFRQAKRTLVVKDGFGTKPCCGQAAGDVSLDGPWLLQLLRHCGDNHAGQGRFNEAVLTRLWPFQEIILSDELQFVDCSVPATSEGAERDETSVQYLFDFGPVFSALQNLAESWSLYGQDGQLDGAEACRFIQAFLRHGQVSRKAVPGARVRSDNVSDLGAAKDSGRKTTKTRDFILAVMPQFWWYRVPKDAKQLTFEELFLDCLLHQAARGGIRFSPLVTVGWETTLRDVEEIPPMTGNVPIPTTLGEFIRLIHGAPPPSLQETLNDNPALGRLRTYPIEVLPVIGVGIRRSFAMHLICSTMRSSKQWWSRAFSGEMGDYNAELQNFQFGEDLTILPSSRDTESVLPRAAAVGVLKLLYTVVRFQSLPAKDVENWDRLQKWLVEESSYPFIECLLRLAALISCGLGIGAYDWSIQNLTPLFTEFRGHELLVLSSYLGSRALAGCEFHVIQTERMDEYERLSLVAICPGPTVPSYGVGLFPGDVFVYDD